MADRILVVDDEPSMRRMLEILFRQEEFEVKVAANADEAFAALAADPYSVVISDIRMPGLSGIDLLRKLREDGGDAEVILVTAYASTESAIEALKLGAFDYITKPFQVDELVHIVRNAVEKHNLREENLFLKVELSQQARFGDIIGGGTQMRQIYALIERIAPTTSTVLIQGESGTGKELVAKAIHERSQRNGRPFISVNCGGIPETLLESELFLDEIGEMSPMMQVKLLRALQERRVRAVGATDDHEVDARVLAATNQDLSRMVAEKRFREDLYYRINVISVQLPPLRKRRDDIPALAAHFLAKRARASDRPVPALTAKALQVLEAHSWPGNIRELENVIERAMALAPGERIEVGHLPESLLNYTMPSSRDDLEIPEQGFSLNKTVEGVRAAHIRRALELEDGVMTRAAARLGITFRSMRYFVKKYHLNAKEG